MKKILVVLISSLFVSISSFGMSCSSDEDLTKKLDFSIVEGIITGNLSKTRFTIKAFVGKMSTNLAGTTIYSLFDQSGEEFLLTVVKSYKLPHSFGCGRGSCRSNTPVLVEKVTAKLEIEGQDDEYFNCF